MTAHTRFSGRLALAAAALLALVSIVAPIQAPAAPTDGCAQALAYEKTAANDTVSRQASYDSAVAGLAANLRCGDAASRLVNEAYLLSMRAAAEHELNINSWRRDFERADMLLVQCTNWPGLRNTKAGNDCATQRQYNIRVVNSLTPKPVPAGSPGPAAPAGTPAAAGATPGPRPVMPTPPPPTRPGAASPATSMPLPAPAGPPMGSPPPRS